jgi:hypothetical protein
MFYYTGEDVYSFQFTNSHPIFYLCVTKFLNLKYRIENGVVNAGNRHYMYQPGGCLMLGKRLKIKHIKDTE